MDEAPEMIDMGKVDISSMMRNIFNEVALELEEKQITAINLLPEDLQVHGNASLIYSIFRNLTDNAIAYAGNNINITVKCFREDENYYYFSFSDTGIGVASEHLNRLFERFYRVSKGNIHDVKGFGLGLSYVKDIVERHGGSITLQSKERQGSTFTLLIPIRK